MGWLCGLVADAIVLILQISSGMKGKREMIAAPALTRGHGTWYSHTGTGQWSLAVQEQLLMLSRGWEPASQRSRASIQIGNSVSGGRRGA